MKKNPSSFFYWNDLENDPNLKTCQWDVRGFWTCKLLPIAARSPQHGVVIIGNHPCVWNGDLPSVLAIDAGASEPDLIDAVASKFLAFLMALVQSGTASVNDDKRLYNRRMVREEEERKHIHDVRSEAGKRGAAARLAILANGKQKLNKGGSKTQANQNPTSDGNNTTIRADAEKNPQQTAGKIKPSSILHYLDKNVTTMVPYSDARIEAIKRMVFDVGLKWFMTNTGCTEPASRSFLGAKLRDHGAEALADALARAEKAAPVDPRSWITRNIATGGKPNGHRPAARRTGNDQAEVQRDGDSASTQGIIAAATRRSVSPRR